VRHIVLTLVVVLLLAVCGGLLVVGIARVRDAAARTQCTNNLKQIALAVHNYQDTYGAVPSADLPNLALPPEKRLSWLVSIVPFVEAGNLYSKMDREKGWDAEENRFAALRVFQTYQCPSFPERPPVSTLVPSHYLGISGIGTDAVALPREDPRAGAFGYRGKLRLGEIERGAGNVLLAIETDRASGSWTTAGPPTVRGLDPGAPPYLGTNGQFGGNHPDGANAVFLDGTVRFLPDSLDPSVLESFATWKGQGAKAGGEE
jgi:prepilin-type processing-associated H-X9-DG protein